LYTPYADKSRLNFFSLNKKENYAGSPTSTTIRDYDFIAGHLFQSETGAKFTPFTDDMKGFDFDPRLIFTDKQITVNIPATVKELKCDSIRVVF